VQAERLILWLFVALSIGTAIALGILTVAAQGFVKPEDYPGVRTRLLVSLAADLMIPIIAWLVLRGIAKRRARKAL
jgi:hypothetical protein